MVKATLTGVVRIALEIPELKLHTLNCLTGPSPAKAPSYQPLLIKPNLLGYYEQNA
jgi:hypothetical protein